MKKNAIKSPAKRGRPRAFKEADVLARATDAFLEHGYSGASLETLTTAMGINKPSLYATFGDKRALFVRVVEEAIAERGRRFRSAFDRGDTLETSLREMFLEAIDVYFDAASSPGCLMVSGATTEAVVDEGLAELTRAFFALSDRVLASWIARRAPERAGARSAVLGRLVNGIIHDLALRSRVGESRAKLREHARDAASALSRC
ncbi:MAG: TetR/AcrR family transcriptional regulator [Polyangiaceae bacterium]